MVGFEQCMSSILRVVYSSVVESNWEPNDPTGVPYIIYIVECRCHVVQ